MKKVLIFDTSILCVWLDVPGMDSCGPDQDKWDKARVQQKIEEEQVNKATFVLPLATIIETGNHISQAKQSRRERAVELAELMKKSADQQTALGGLFGTKRIMDSGEIKKACRIMAGFSCGEIVHR